MAHSPPPRAPGSAANWWQLAVAGTALGVVIFGPTACGGAPTSPVPAGPKYGCGGTEVATNGAFAPSVKVTDSGSIRRGKDGFYHGSVRLVISNGGKGKGVAEWRLFAVEQFRGNEDYKWATIERVQPSHGLSSIGRYPGPDGPGSDFSVSYGYGPEADTTVDVDYRLPVDFVMTSKRGGLTMFLRPNATPGANVGWGDNCAPSWTPSYEPPVQGTLPVARSGLTG